MRKSGWTNAPRGLARVPLAAAVILTVSLAGEASGGAMVADSAITVSGSLARGDDTYSSAIPLGFTANLWGTSRSSVYVNVNGNLTFNSGFSNFVPNELRSLGRDIIAPFWDDVDTRGTGTITYGTTVSGGNNAFVVTWAGVGYFSYGTDRVNSFQTLLVNRPDVAAGDFDIVLNYDSITWGTPYVGFSSADGLQYYQMTGSGVSGAFLNSNTSTGLIYQSNVGVSGRYIYEVRSGGIIVAPTTIDTSREFFTQADSQVTGSQIIFNGGTLKLTDNVTIAAAITINSTGGTVNTNGYATTWSGVVSGAGALTKTGSGTLTLTGANTYTGGTTISAGTLIGSTTSLTGNIVDDAALVFDQASDGTFAGVVSGTGTVAKTGSGKLTLTGANTYTGGTTISAGTLIGSTTSLTGNIVDNAALVFDQASDGTFAGVVSGTGTVAKTGSGKLTLTGANTYTGGMSVQAGSLRILGSLSGLTSVANGAAVYGTGTLAALVNGGRVAPGDTSTIGALRVSGSYTQTSGGVLDVRITPTSADKLSVGGAATLDGSLIVRPAAGTYTAGTTYQIVTANSVSGTFKAVAIENSERLAGLVLGVTYLGNEVDLQLTNALTASSRQQEEAVKAIAPEVARQTTSVQTSLIGARIASVFAPRATPTSSGSPTPSTTTGGNAKQSSLSGLAAGDDAAPDDRFGGLSVWGDAGAAYMNNTRSASKYHGWLKSAVLGVDYRLGDTWVVGAALSPDQTSLKLSSVDGDRDTAGVGVSLYAGYKIDDTYSVSVIGGYGRAFVNGKQSVAGGDVKDSYGSNRYNAQVALSAGYKLGDDLRLSPTISYTHAIETTAKHHSDDGAEVKIPTSSLGTIRAEARLELTTNDKFVPFLVGGVEHDVVNSGGSTGRTGFTAGGGVQVPYDENLTLGALALADFGRDGQSTFRFGANARFSW